MLLRGKNTCDKDEIVTLFSGTKPSISQNGDKSWTATFDTEQTKKSAIKYMNLEDIKSSFVGCKSLQSE
jgi:hypothetical protein